MVLFFKSNYKLKIVFDVTVQESKNDDFRFDWKLWYNWLK